MGRSQAGLKNFNSDSETPDLGIDSFQWCRATGQGAMGTNWGTGSSIWTWGRTSSLWGWWSTGTGCPGRLWCLLLWRHSRPAWTRSCAACCRWPCFGRGVGLDDPQRSFPIPTILWFCDSVILWFEIRCSIWVAVMFQGHLACCVFSPTSSKVKESSGKFYRSSAVNSTVIARLLGVCVARFW